MADAAFAECTERCYGVSEAASAPERTEQQRQEIGTDRIGRSDDRLPDARSHGIRHGCLRRYGDARDGRGADAAADVVNLFLQSSAVQFAVSVIGVLIFSALTAYDTQRASAAGKAAIMGALSLYLDFINLSVSLLHIFGDRDADCIAQGDHQQRDSMATMISQPFRSTP